MTMGNDEIILTIGIPNYNRSDLLRLLVGDTISQIRSISKDTGGVLKSLFVTTTRRTIRSMLSANWQRTIPMSQSGSRGTQPTSISRGISKRQSAFLAASSCFSCPTTMDFSPMQSRRFWKSSRSIPTSRSDFSRNRRLKKRLPPRYVRSIQAKTPTTVSDPNGSRRTIPVCHVSFPDGFSTANSGSVNRGRNGSLRMPCKYQSECP